MTETSDIEDAPESVPAGGGAAADRAAEGAGANGEFDYHLHLDPAEAELASGALRLLISDEAHEHEIRELARGVLAKLAMPPQDNGVAVLALAPREMKITHTAVRLRFDDLQREQADERRVLRQILEKLPDEHAIRAIGLD